MYQEYYGKSNDGDNGENIKFSYFYQCIQQFINTNIIASINTLDEAQEALIERRVAENKRYKKIYGINCEDFNKYDVVIDTTSITPDRAVEIIMECYNRKKDGLPYEKLWISPQTLFPTRPIKKIDMEKLQKSYRS